MLQRFQKFSIQNRKPLELQHHKPIPIPTHIPKFQEKYIINFIYLLISNTIIYFLNLFLMIISFFTYSFSIDKHYDPDKERAKLNKLKSQYKKERKGAIRELRKDSQFIARQHTNEIKEKDIIYKKKINNIMYILENEQSEKKAFEKAKKYGKL